MENLLPSPDSERFMTIVVESVLYAAASAKTGSIEKTGGKPQNTIQLRYFQNLFRRSTAQGKVLVIPNTRWNATRFNTGHIDNIGIFQK